MVCDPLPGWLDAVGPHADLVVSTRVRVARNLAGFPFGGRSQPEQREAIHRLIASAVAHAPSLAAGRWYRFDQMARPDRLWFHERQQSSRELAGLLEPAGRAGPGAALLVANTAALMVNEEDHLRLQVILPGFAAAAAYRATTAIHRELDQQISFAFHPEFGYLTSCHTNVGTGLRVSVLLHLPTLVWTREIAKVLAGLSQIGVTCRGFWGEASDVVGDLFQLSNQVTLGRRPSELLGHIERVVGEVIEHERRARAAVWERSRREADDRVWRAWGLLRHARLLGFRELAALVGDVRLGVTLGVLPRVSLTTVNHLLVLGQDAHVARWADTGIDDDALPAHRAALVHRMLDEGDPG
jgi:protein arginine kinase